MTCLLLFCLTLRIGLGGLIAVQEVGTAPINSPANVWQLMPIKSKASLRGLHVLDRNHVWASGTGGTIIHTNDGGQSWNEQTIVGAEELDFRDIHALDQDTVVAMTSGTPARIYRTADGGQSWKLCFENKNPKVFLDALSFWDDQHGIVMGDPIDDVVFLLQTKDGGQTWSRLATAPASKPGEAGFAASGTNMIHCGQQQLMIAMGGHLPDQTSPTSRLLLSADRGTTWNDSEVPIGRGPAAGIFSICCLDAKRMVAVGGDYLKPENTENNYATSSDGGKSWQVPDRRKPPSGYRSCVAVHQFGGKSTLIAVGPNGTDRSADFGQSWKRVSETGFHAVAFSPDGQVGWASGSDGRIAKWVGKASSN